MIIPSLPLYDVSETGVVTFAASGRIIEEKRNRSGLRSVTLSKKGHKTNLLIARLVLEAFKPVGEGLSTDWLSVTYFDGNKDNVSLSNLDWDNSLYIPKIIPGVTHPLDAWFPVFGRDDFEVSFQDSVVFRNPCTGNYYTCFVANSGYLTVIAPGGKYYHVHRLLASMFLPHPHDIGHLTVNHKDSNKLNNSLSNFEWVTQSENNQHAVETGNRSGGGKPRRVCMLELDSGIVSSYPSIQEASRFLDSNPGQIHSLLAYGQRRGLGYKGFLIKYEDDPTPWTELRNETERNKTPYRIAVKDMRSGEIVVYDSLMKTVSNEFINPKTIYRLLWNEFIIPWNGKCFQTYKEKMVWPDYPPELVEAYRHVRTGGRPFKVTYPDGTTEFSAGVTEWCKNNPQWEGNSAVVNRAISRDGEWRGIKFDYVKLDDYQ